MLGFKTIRSKIMNMVMVVFTIALFVQLSSQYFQVKEQAFNTLDSMNETINTMLFEYITAYVYNRDTNNIQLSIDAIKSKYIKAIYVLDEAGKIIAKDHDIKAQELKYSRFDMLLKAKEKSIKNTDEYLILNTFSILEVPVGYMVIEGNLQAYRDNLATEMKRHGMEMMVFLFLFLIAAILLSQSLSRPLENMIKKLQYVKANETLQFEKQDQIEFEYLCDNISRAHNRVKVVNENLEDEVNKKTQELQELNATLQEKVSQAIQEVEYKSQMLQQQTRLAQMGEMISMIAHQWRQPLSTIAAVSMNMKMIFALQQYDLSKEDEREAFEKDFNKNLDSISELVQTLTMTIDDFRNFYKSEKERKKVSINEPLEKALNIIETSITSSGITIHKTLKSKNNVSMLSSEMMQVVLNILKNAQDNFIERDVENARLEIQSSDTSRGVRLEISDNGGGIADDILAKVFDPYFSTKNEKNGTGLGLYMSKTIVEEHHDGSLEAINHDVGVSFIIELDSSNVAE